MSDSTKHQPYDPAHNAWNDLSRREKAAWIAVITGGFGFGLTNLPATLWERSPRFDHTQSQVYEWLLIASDALWLWLMASLITLYLMKAKSSSLLVKILVCLVLIAAGVPTVLDLIERLRPALP